ncbi:hypothetical protein KI688_009106 [Linnemannia hyalina]|uniref:Uncharacterized protein n=1 Tax=Linnemannia hyalina TaxID=64524 RepID=A0A9P7Y1V8_9FUNG|nr:hypothetical protein KI688_009106 [Linnemannia hyalina]
MTLSSRCKTVVLGIRRQATEVINITNTTNTADTTNATNTTSTEILNEGLRKSLLVGANVVYRCQVHYFVGSGSNQDLLAGPTIGARASRINGKRLETIPNGFRFQVLAFKLNELHSDVTQLWRCDPKSIKILGIDLDQEFVVRASAILPTREQPNVEQVQESSVTTMESSLSSVESEEDEEALHLLFDTGAYKCLQLPACSPYTIY